jgi:hypothetical protein
MLWCILYIWDDFFLKRIKISIFGGISKFHRLIVFGQILTRFGSFGQIQLLWQWLTSCSHLKRKEKNFITFAKGVKILSVTACWKAL